MGKEDNTGELLKAVLKNFDLPEHRKTNQTIHNLKWLLRNLSVRNSKHPRFEEAINLIKQQIN